MLSLEEYQVNKLDKTSNSTLEASNASHSPLAWVHEIRMLIGLFTVLFILVSLTSFSKWDEISSNLLILGYIYPSSFFSNQEALRNYVESFGVFAPIVFIILQIIQVVVTPFSHLRLLSH